ncbi:MAG: hypothetical protein MUF21_02005 [Gemmatimonadaceae bacterium]|jgi:hypothetical protein|nr:hypothetical protein [Gemmatimonadaceae bacterium]
MPMLRPFRRFALTTAFAALTAAAPSLLAAQELTPPKGTWGAEVTTGSLNALAVGGANLIYFATPTLSLVFGGNADVQQDFTSIGAQFGLRRYAMRPGKLRPILGGGVQLFNGDFNGTRSTSVGVYGEGGAAWFFTRNVSLGATASLRVGINDGGFRDGTQVNFSLVRLHAAVFF